MDLKETLGEEKYGELMETIGEDNAIFVHPKKTEKGEDVTVGITNNGTYMPVTDFVKEKKARQELQTQYDGLNNKVSDLSKFSEENLELKAQLEKIQSDSETWKSEAVKREERIIKRSKAERYFDRKGCSATHLIMKAHFSNDDEVDKMQMLNGEIVGADQILSPYTEQYKPLFNVTTVEGNPLVTGDRPPGPKKPTPEIIKKAADKNISPETYMNIYKE